MKKLHLFLTVAALSSASFAAVSKYSGIYNLKVADRGLLAITKGGRLLTLSDDTSMRAELNPATSTVDSKGKIVGSTRDGLSVTASISSKFKLTGTVKEGSKTARVTGSRIYK